MTYDRRPPNPNDPDEPAEPVEPVDDDTQVVEPANPRNPPAGTGSSAARGLRAPGSRSSTRGLRGSDGSPARLRAAGRLEQRQCLPFGNRGRRRSGPALLRAADRVPAVRVRFTLLIVRIVMLLFVADPGNDIVDFVYSVTEPFVAPFRGMFQFDQSVSG